MPPALHTLVIGVSELTAHAARLGFGTVAALAVGLAFVSAVVPWVNAEVLMVGVAAIAGSNGELALLVLLVSAGQMAGKCIIYYAGRRGGQASSGRMAALIDRWRARASRTPWSPIALVTVSSIVGIPPFYVTSAIAGALRMNVVAFLVAGTCGRVVRFGVIALGAQATVLQL